MPELSLSGGIIAGSKHPCLVPYQFLPMSMPNTLRAALLLAVSAALCPGRALAQTQPALPGAPTAPVAAPPAPAPLPPAALPAPPPADDLYRLSRTYRIETTTGSTFTGTLISLSLTALELDTRDLGRVTVPRANIRRSYDETPAAAPGTAAPAAVRPGYYDIGNGNRLFFAPTGRGLRRGEGSLQNVNLYLLGLNYGITDNFSFGGYLSVVPGLALTDQLLVLTPKVSFPVGNKLNFGAGLLYLRVPTGSTSSVGAGIGYGALTYGSAEHNLTLGLGYGFVQGEIGRTPVVQVGGQTRVSRRVSLVSENYIIADSRAGLGGLYGLKINWRRTSLGLGALYFQTFGYDEQVTNALYNPNTGTYTYYTTTQRQKGTGFSTYIIPVYYDFSFRFGKGAK